MFYIACTSPTRPPQEIRSLLLTHSAMSSQLLSTPATHPFSLAALADRVWMATTEGAFHLGAYSWGSPLCRLAEAAVVRYDVSCLAVCALLTVSHTGRYRVSNMDSYVSTRPIGPTYFQIQLLPRRYEQRFGSYGQHSGSGCA